MAIPTLQQTLDAARSHLGDDTVAGGEVFTNTKLQEHFAKAYRVLYRAMSSVGNRKVYREVYHVIPANTNFLDPSTAGITDFGEPYFLEERGDLTTKAITGASGTTTVTLAVVGHGRDTGDLATVNGIVGFGGTEGLWGITTSGVDALILNGCIGSGSYSSGGTLIYSPENFTDMVDVGRFDRINPQQATSGAFGSYVWWNDAYHFRPCGEARQLRISYSASGAAPTSTSASIGIDDSTDFLATYTAALALASRGDTQRADELKVEALGQFKSVTPSGGLLHEFLTLAVKAEQRKPPEARRRRPFRDPHSIAPTIY